MKKLLILLSIFFLLSNSNVNSAGRSDAAAAVATAQKKRRVESSESKEAAQVGRYPGYSIEDRKVMEELALAFPHIPAVISGIILDYYKLRFDRVYNFPGHSQEIKSLIKLDDRRFASGSKDETIKIWEYDREAAQWKCIQVLAQSDGRSPHSVNALIKLNDTHFVSGSLSTIKIWKYNPDSDQWECVHTLKNFFRVGMVNVLEVLNDRYFAFASGSDDSTIKIWKYNPGSRELECIQPLYHHEDRRLCDVTAFIKIDDIYYASGAADGTIKIWRFNLETTLFECALSPISGSYASVSLIKLNDMHFASSSIDQKTIKIWELIPATASTPMQCRCIATLDHTNSGHTDNIKVLIKLDDTHFASGSGDRTIKIWECNPEAGQWECIQTVTLDNSISSIAYNRNLIAGLSNGTMQIWKPKNIEL